MGTHSSDLFIYLWQDAWKMWEVHSNQATISKMILFHYLSIETGETSVQR